MVPTRKYTSNVYNKVHLKYVSVKVTPVKNTRSFISKEEISTAKKTTMTKYILSRYYILHFQTVLLNERPVVCGPREQIT